MSSVAQGAFDGAKILITGATGFTGRVLTRKLADAGAQITAIARRSSKIGDLDDINVNWVRGDVYDAETIQTAVQGVEYIFHLAAAFREEKGTDAGYRRVHVRSTELLAQALVGKAEFKRFVHVSTVGVHGHIEAERADENYPFDPGDGYQRTKLEGELWLGDFAAKNNIPFTIIRPVPIFGPGDGRLLKFFKMIDKGYLPMLGLNRSGIYHLVHVDDLTEIFMRAALLDAALSQTFIAANESPVSIEDMGKIIAKALGKKVRVIRLPITPFFIAADVCKAVCLPFGIQPPIYRRRVAFYTKDRKFDITKLKTVLGYTPKYNNESGLTETAQWYAKHEWL